MIILDITDELLDEYIERLNNANIGFWAEKESDDYIIFYDQNVEEDYFDEIAIPDNFSALQADIFNIYDYFDIDEHVEMWLEARQNGVAGVPSARELVEESEQIKADLDELVTTSEKIIVELESEFGTK